MNGIHDIGGLEGFGPVKVEPDEPFFHEPWERQAFRLTTAAFSLARSGGQFRHSIERMDPAEYLDASYYEHWLTGVATVLVEDGHVSRTELEVRAAPFPLARPMATLAAHPGPSSDAPRFALGDRVRVRQWHWPGHTRCPRYVQGKRGTVVRVDVVASVPDVEAHSDSRQQVPTYSVRFEAAELWGTAPEPGVAAVHVDLWETYLEPEGAEP